MVAVPPACNIETPSRMKEAFLLQGISKFELESFDKILKSVVFEARTCATVPHLPVRRNPMPASLSSNFPPQFPAQAAVTSIATSISSARHCRCRWKPPSPSPFRWPSRSPSPQCARPCPSRPLWSLPLPLTPPPGRAPSPVPDPCS